MKRSKNIFVKLCNCHCPNVNNIVDCYYKEGEYYITLLIGGDRTNFWQITQNEHDILIEFLTKHGYLDNGKHSKFYRFKQGARDYIININHVTTFSYETRRVYTQDGGSFNMNIYKNELEQFVQFLKNCGYYDE